jgi:hypothetical protein
MEPHSPIGDQPDDALTSEPVPFGEVPRDVLTPMGQVDSIGLFARGLGARRVKILITIGGVLALAVALLAALQ